MIRTDTKAMLPIARPKGSVTGTLPVLISVPATSLPRGRQHRQASRPRPDHRVIYLADRQTPFGRRKRRLKREVRATARILTLTAALLFVTTVGPSLSSARRPLLAMPLPSRTNLPVLSHNIPAPIAPPAGAQLGTREIEKASQGWLGSVLRPQMSSPSTQDSATSKIGSRTPPATPAPEVASTKPETTEDSSVVLLSAEPQPMTPRPDSEIPVVLPGYVLPAESFEEPVHEGS
jgi:hypothetical protein